MKKSFWSKPMTWGGYAKLNVIVFIAGAVYGAAWWLVSFTDILDRIHDWFQEKFHKKPNYNYEEDFLEKDV